jgi:hypothetical protein
MTIPVLSNPAAKILNGAITSAQIATGTILTKGSNLNMMHTANSMEHIPAPWNFVLQPDSYDLDALQELLHQYPYDSYEILVVVNGMRQMHVYDISLAMQIKLKFLDNK